MIQHAKRYIEVSIVSCYFFGQFDLQKRFLNCVNVTWVPMVVQVVATILHALWCHIFVGIYGWDLEGLALASTLTSFILLSFSVIYPYFIEGIRDALIWPDSSVWSGWKEYFSLGVPTTGMLCAEYWAWESLAFLSGHLGVVA